MIAFTLACIVLTLALGAFSSSTFAWQWLVGAPTARSSVALLLVVAGISIALFRYLRRRAPPEPSAPAGFAILLGIACLIVAYSVIRCLYVAPLGGLDAVAIWNLHASFLYRGQDGLWKGVFDPALFWSHNDYPLLLPGLIEGGWILAGAEHSVVPKILAIWFGFTAVAIVGGATCAFTRDSRGWLAALILLVTPSFVLQWPDQMADVPLAVYILIAVVLVQLAAVWLHLRVALLALAGLSAGFAAWTKNEGLLFVVAFFVSIGLSHLLLFAWNRYRHNAQRRSGFSRQVLTIALGLIPVLALLVGFKVLLAPPGDIELNAAAIPRLTTLSRYTQIASAFAVGLVYFGDVYQAGGTSPALLLGLSLLFHKARIRQISATSLSLMLLPVLMLAGDFMVYVVTPRPLEWHLRTSLTRVLLQLWPAVVFISTTVQFAMTASPAETD
jgi:hypothetical protein